MALVKGNRGDTSPWLRALVTVLAGAAVSCGDSLVDELYSGTPLYTVEGKVVSTSSSVNEQQPLATLALFWNPGGAADMSRMAEQPGTAHDVEYYRAFKVNLFDEPGADMLATAPSGARYGIAHFAAYRDANHNGRKDASESFLGSEHQTGLIRAPQPLSAEDSPTGAPLAAGWHIVSTPLMCPSLPPGPPPPVADGDCGVPLGIECKTDADCGDGVCVRQAAGPWPGGACAIPEPPPHGCRQRGSVLMRVVDPEAPQYWIQGCSETADCQRPEPYQCDQQLHGCRPSLNISVEVLDNDSPAPFCLR
jgi:hypothetical protein